MMSLSLGEKFNSQNKNLLTTIAKSLKHSCNRTMGVDSVQNLDNEIVNYLDLCDNPDIDVRRYTIESLVTVCHS